MKVDEIRSELLRLLRPALEPFGFVPRKAADLEFVRKHEQVSHLFRVYVKPWSGSTTVETTVFVGCPLLTRVFNEILKRKVTNGAPCCGFGIQNRFPERGFYRIVSSSDLVASAEAVASDWREVALPYFGVVTSVEAIDAELNGRDAEGRLAVHAVDRACVGLIAADLARNPCFSEIADVRYRSCVESQGPALARPIQVVRDYLETKRRLKAQPGATDNPDDAQRLREDH